MPLLLALAAACLPSGVTATEPVRTATPSASAMVILDGMELFAVHARVGSFTAADRARALSERLERLARDPGVAPEAIEVVGGDGTTDIAAAGRVLLEVTEADAAAAAQPRAELAKEWLQAIRAAITSFRSAHSTSGTLLGLLYAALATAALLLLFSLTRRGFRILLEKLESWRSTRIRPLRIQALELVSASRMTDALLLVLRGVRLATWVGLVLLYASLVFSLFPMTRAAAARVTGYVTAAVGAVATAVISYLPSVAFILVIGAVGYVAVKFLRLLFGAIEAGKIVLPRFYPDWAQPTFKIARFFVIVLAAIVIFPYVPGSESPAFRAISLFLGAVVSLGSTSAVSSILAGVMLTYTRAFQVGDRVQIGDAIGDVVERTLLVTRIRTIKNVEVTIPNSQVLGSHVSNYNACALHPGLILHSTVTIGYDAPWRKVHELLIGAALATPSILAQPRPFVLQTSLDDFFVSYQINGFTDQPNRMAETLASLHALIQDAFNEAGVEICSPHFRALRDGNRMAVPEDHLPEGYVAPTFRVAGSARAEGE